jgi:hypothetical protein
MLLVAGVVSGEVKIDPTNPQVAYVTGPYMCPSTGVKHMWVSVKQVDSLKPIKALKGEGSSSVTARGTSARTGSTPARPSRVASAR